MKNTKQIILVIFFLTSCVSIKNAGDLDYEKDFEHREVPYANCFAALPFTLDYVQPACYPIIKINNSFLLLDTGANYTLVGESGLKDLFYDSYEYILKQKELLHEDRNFNILNQQIGFWTIPAFNGDKKDIPFYFTNSEFDLFDGIIGEDCFRQFSNIIIDYQNRVIVFNGEKIKGEEVPMIIDEEGLCFIEFTCDGNKEIGLIDTGSDGFLLRSSYFDKPCDYDFATSEKINELKNRKAKSTEPHDYLFKSIKIGNRNYKNKIALLSSDSRIRMSDEARARLSEYSCLGFSFFADRIIQLDFENKVFRIE